MFKQIEHEVDGITYYPCYYCGELVEEHYSKKHNIYCCEDCADKIDKHKKKKGDGE